MFWRRLGYLHLFGDTSFPSCTKLRPPPMGRNDANMAKTWLTQEKGATKEPSTKNLESPNVAAQVGDLLKKPHFPGHVFPRLAGMRRTCRKSLRRGTTFWWHGVREA